MTPAFRISDRQPKPRLHRMAAPRFFCRGNATPPSQRIGIRWRALPVQHAHR